jgi:hypothetical protein
VSGGRSPGRPAPALREGEPVALEADGAPGPLPCRVAAFHGPHLTLLPARALDAEERAALAAGPGAFVLHARGGVLRALRADVRAVRPDGRIVLRCPERARFGERRRHSRAGLRLPARVRALDGTPAGRAPVLDTVTLDVGPGGARLALPADLPGACAALALEITLPDGRVASAMAARLHETAGELVVRFAALTEGDERALARAVLDHHVAAVRACEDGGEPGAAPW